jgi:hypothetical protein
LFVGNTLTKAILKRESESSPFFVCKNDVN